MRRTLLTALSFTAVVAWGQAAGAATISISCGAVGAELQLCKEGAEAWAKKSGNEVKVVSHAELGDRAAGALPADAGGGLGRHRRLPDRRDLAGHPRQPLHRPDASTCRRSSSTSTSRRSSTTTRSSGKLVAMPWFTDAGVLYYRKDLLGEVRQEAADDLAGADRPTRQEIAGQASARPATTQMRGFVFQGKAYEGLTCNALEWVDSFGGGTIVDDERQDHDQQPEGGRGAGPGRPRWIGKIAPEGVLNYCRGGGARRLPVGQRRLHAQLALCLGARAGAGQPGQGQGRRGGPAEGRRGRQAHRQRSAAGSSRSRSTARTRTPRPTSSAT